MILCNQLNYHGMFVGKPQISVFIVLSKKKGKHCEIMLNKAYLNSFCLSPCMKRKTRKCPPKKFWLGLQFCRIPQRVLQLQYLQMSGNISSTLIGLANISPCCLGARRPYRTSAEIEVPEREGEGRGGGASQQIFIQGGSALTLFYTIFDRKVPLPYRSFSLSRNKKNKLETVQWKKPRK